MSTLIEDNLWDHYSGLPNPMWYHYDKLKEDEEESAIDSNDTEVVTE
jgi:hypothetical protein